MQDETQNIAQTVRDTVEDLAHVETIETAHGALSESEFVAVPSHKKIEDLTPLRRATIEKLRPIQKRGTAMMLTLESLIDWSNRFKGDNSALFASADPEKPTLTVIADYHVAGHAVIDDLGDENARHCAHRALYEFPVSRAWKDWTEKSGQALDKDELGKFLEDHALDVLDPTPAILDDEISEKNADWENRHIETAARLEGRFGTLHQLLHLSREFSIHETSNLTVKKNRDTGEQEISFLNEHKTPEGKPLKIPNLFLIAIPVFEQGALYRIAARLQYRKNGGALTFGLTLFNSENAFDDAMREAVKTAQNETKLPVFWGTPEK